MISGRNKFEIDVQIVFRSSSGSMGSVEMAGSADRVRRGWHGLSSYKGAFGFDSKTQIFDSSNSDPSTTTKHCCFNMLVSYKEHTTVA